MKPKFKYDITVIQGLAEFTVEVEAYDILGAITQAVVKIEMEHNIRLKQIDHISATQKE